MSNSDDDTQDPPVNLNGEYAGDDGSESIYSDVTPFPLEDYTSSNAEIIVKPVLPPKPSRPTRNMMRNTGNSASIKTLPQIKKAYDTLRDKHSSLILHVNESNNNWGARDRCATSHIDNLYSVSTRLSRLM